MLQLLESFLCNALLQSTHACTRHQHCCWLCLQMCIGMNVCMYVFMHIRAQRISILISALLSGCISVCESVIYLCMLCVHMHTSMHPQSIHTYIGTRKWYNSLNISLALEGVHVYMCIMCVCLCMHVYEFVCVCAWICAFKRYYEPCIWVCVCVYICVCVCVCARRRYLHINYISRSNLQSEHTPLSIL
jgi:hypothetical protein